MRRTAIWELVALVTLTACGSPASLPNDRTSTSAPAPKVSMPATAADAVEPTVITGEWEELPDTRLESINPCPANNCVYSANLGFSSIIAAWSSGAIVGDQFVIFGGGHKGYWGNELATFDLATHTWRLFTEPSPYEASNSPYKLPDGRPGSRHTYNHIQSYDNRYLLVLGDYGVAALGTSFGDYVWTADLQATGEPWEEKGKLGDGIRNDAGAMVLGYTLSNQVTGKAYYHKSFSGRFYEYDPATNTHRYLTQKPLQSYATGAVDTTRNRALVIGGGGNVGWVWDFKRSRPGFTDLRGFGRAWARRGLSMAATSAPGIDFDPVNDLFVVWANGGKTVHLIDAETFAITDYTPVGGVTPGPASNTGKSFPNGVGTYGRFRYSSMDGYFYLINATDQNVYRIRFSRQAAAG